MPGLRDADGVAARNADAWTELVTDLYKVAMFDDRGNHARLLLKIKETLLAHGIDYTDGVMASDHQTE